MANPFSDILVDDDWLFADDAEELLFDDDDEEEIDLDEMEGEDSWQIMIVDDDIKVHLVTKLSLKNFRFDEKPLSFVSAYSGTEAKRLIGEYPNIALILLDVVMESHNAGLMVAQHVREVLQNEAVRIILRTGQPGQAPEESIILAYDINDYKTKTELTQQKLFTAIMSALRSYRDITTIKDSRDELEILYADLAKRNVELKKANQQLQQEIAERQKLEVIRLEQERRRLENEFLERESRQLAKLNADKNKYFTFNNKAQDLKGPLEPLLGYSELLLLAPDRLTPAKIQSIGEQIQNSAKNLDELLENLLLWSRMQMGRMEYEPKVINLAKIIDESLRLLTENAIKKQITLQSNVSEKLLVHADQNMLNTVIRNLVSNALKFTSKGGKVTISARQQPNGEGLTECAALTSKIEVSVTDTGVGMTPEHAKALLQIEPHSLPSSHITTPSTEHGTGTGLGLVICQEMVEKNGGQIWIESKLGQGTTVRFTVPVMT